MKNILLAIIAILLATTLGFCIFAYFVSKSNSELKLSNDETTSNSKKKTNKNLDNPDNNDSQIRPTDENSIVNESPTMVEVLTMIDNGQNVAGIIDQEGNTWSQNGDKTVSYTNPQGESYTASLGFRGEIDGTDFNRTYSGGEDSPIEYATEPDPEVIAQLQEEIDNAGLQTELEAKQKELDEYIDSFPK